MPSLPKGKEGRKGMYMLISVSLGQHIVPQVHNMSTSAASSNKNLDQLDCSFMYTQILKEILLTIDFKQQYFNEFIDLCRNVMTHDKQSAIVQKFEREYRDKTPIRWYTYECFLCPMLNRA
jgi:hypothetical protein